MSVVQYVRPLPEAISTRRGFCTVGKQPAIDGQFIAAVTNKKLPCALQLEASPLRLLMLHSGSSPSLPFTYLNLVHEDVQWETFMCI